MELGNEEQKFLSSLAQQHSTILRNLLSMNQRIGCEEGT